MDGSIDADGLRTHPMKLTVRLVILLVAVAFLSLSCRRVPVSAKSPVGLEAISPSDDTPARMRHFAEQAVIDAAGRYRTQLDYSPESVEAVERILDSLARASNAQRSTDADLRAEALIFGAYIGEVIRRQHGGEWARDHQQAGPGSYPLSWQGHDSFPYGWCYKRLTNGPEDNVWHKYQYFVSKSLDPTVPIEVTKTKVNQ